MDTATISAIVIASYFFILAAYSYVSYLKQSSQGYVIGERNFGLFTTVCSMLAGQFNGGGVFFIFTFGLMIGYGQLWFALGFLAGYIVISFFAKEVHEEGKKYGDINVPDILKRRIGSYTQHFGSFIVIGKACLFGTAQLLIAGTVVSALFGLPNAWGVWLTSAVIGLYVYLGGYSTVVKTDVIQWMFLFVVSLLAALFLPKPDFMNVVNEVIATDNALRWGFFLFTFMLIISNADVWQRMMSAREPSVAIISLNVSGVLFIVFTLMTVLILKSWNIAEGVKFFDLFHDQLLSPVVLAILGTFTLIAVMSTIDTQVQLFSSSVTKNVLKLNVSEEKTKFVKVSRVLTVLLLAFLAVVASTLGSTLEFVLKAFSFAYILAPIMVFAMLAGREGSSFKDGTCVVALVIGLIVYIYMFFNGYFAEVINNVIPASITAVVCILGLVLDKSIRVARA